MLSHALATALNLIISLDPDLVEIVLLSLRVSGTALILATLLGVGTAFLLGNYRLPGKGMIVTLINTLTGLPPVVVGLALYLLLSRQGLLGFLDILYSPMAMIIAQTVLAAPIVAALSHAALESAGSAVRQTAYGLGATRKQAAVVVLREARYAIGAGVATAFGRVVAEVGAVLVVGGNIAHHTRVMTTAIALEADRGDFELAIALGIVLLLISFVVNGFLYTFQKRGGGR